MQNAHYADALKAGIASAQTESGAVNAVLAVTAPLVECNRVQVDDERIYVRETLFGDAGEEHHAEALRIVEETSAALLFLIHSNTSFDEAEAAARAQIISSALYVAMASATPESAVAEFLAAFRTQAQAALGSKG